MPGTVQHVVAGADHQPLVHLFQAGTAGSPVPVWPVRTPAPLSSSAAVTLPPPFRPQLPPHPVPSRQTRYAAPGRGRDCRSVASPTRSDEGVHPQGIEVIDRLSRVVARVGGDFPGHGPGVEHGLLNHSHGLTLIRAARSPDERFHHRAVVALDGPSLNEPA